MKNILLVFLFSLFCSAFSQSEFQLDADLGRFFYSDSASRVEFYYSLYKNQFSKVIQNGQEIIEGNLQLKIYDATNSNLLLDRKFKIQDNITYDEDKNIIGNTISGTLTYYLSFGDYKCVLSAVDKNDEKRNATVELNVKLGAIEPQKFGISDIQLSTNIKEEDENSFNQFVKNGYEVTPNASLIYGAQSPILFTYAEFYNINKNIKSNNLVVQYRILSSNNYEYIKKIKKINRELNSVVDINFFNLIKLPSDTYTLVISLIDSVLNEKVSAYKRFYHFNPDVKDTIKDVVVQKDIYASEFYVMNEDELNEAYDYVRYIATADEQAKWIKLTSIDAKRNFLFNFWSMRDPDPTTPQNELKIEYFKRVDYVNKKYPSKFKRGYKTDRGRVFILYGEPTEIERFPNEPEYRPYEMWKYSSLQGQGGIYFIFGDLMGNGEYQLINSNLVGELKDDNWLRKLKL